MKFSMLCVKDFLMTNGERAFKKDTQYEFLVEKGGKGSKFFLKDWCFLTESEISPKHNMDTSCLGEYFKPLDSQFLVLFGK